MPDPNWLTPVLEDVREASLWREDREVTRNGALVTRPGHDSPLLNFSSNDYLGLSQHPGIKEVAARAITEIGFGAGAARLVTGTNREHHLLEETLAEWLHNDAALVFGSGYLCNLGVVTSIARRHDIVVADRAVHASLIDGILLSGAKLYRYRHNDTEDLKTILEKVKNERRAESRVVLVTESVFSMDGDIAPLAEIAALAVKHDAMLLVDEAHALGIFGPRGGGVSHEVSVSEKVSLTMGTLSKALGGYGGFVCGSRPFRDLLVNSARSFIFSTSLPPAVALGGVVAIKIIRDNPQRGLALRDKAARFRMCLQRAGLNTLQSESQIIPVVIGDNDQALKFSHCLEEKGILGVCIRPPTVPVGTARIRFSVTAVHSDEELAQAADIIISTAMEAKLL